MTGSQAHPIQQVTVSGDGPALAGIAQVMATAGYEVTLCAVAGVLESAREEIEGGRFGLAAAADAGRISSGERALALERLRFSEAPEDATAAADLAIVSCGRGADALAPRLATLESGLPAGDSSVSSLAALLGDVEGALGPRGVLAVDSPGEPLEILAAGLARPERLVGWHWGWPPQVSKLAEITAGAATEGAVVDSVVQAARRAGKNPVVIADAPDEWGYVTNRLWAKLRAEAERIVADGTARPEQIDQLTADAFGWPAGPFERGSATN